MRSLTEPDSFVSSPAHLLSNFHQNGNTFCGSAYSKSNFPFVARRVSMWLPNFSTFFNLVKMLKNTPLKVKLQFKK